MVMIAGGFVTLNRGQGQGALQHAARRTQAVGQFAHLCSGAAQGHDFQTVVKIKVNMQGGQHGIVGLVLHGRQATGKIAFHMIVDQCQHARHAPIGIGGEIVGQFAPYAVTQGFGAIGVARGGG